MELVYRSLGHSYVLAAEDGRLEMVDPDRDAIIRQLIELKAAYNDRSIWRVEAYAPLGPWLKVLREGGFICRMKLGEPPPPWRLRYQMPGDAVPDPPSPTFASWGDYITRTTCSERMKRCHKAAGEANKERPMSPAPNVVIRGADVWTVIEAAKGRCCHCGSLAVEKRPSAANGATRPWAQVGRRVGSLHHKRPRAAGECDNEAWNLAWSCLWCNDWKGELRPGATDHGGYYPA